jgi:hypothetical protein
LVIFGRRLEQPSAAAWTWVLRFAGEPKWAIGGKMGFQTCLPASRIFRFSRLLPDSPHFFSVFSVFSVFARHLASVARVGLALALLLLLPMEQGELFAQQATYYGQYAPYPQPRAYGQPTYAQQPYTSYPQQTYPQQTYGQAQPLAQPLNAQQLEQLVAPIALYPDNLVAQVLTASTYPLQIVDADRWRQAQGSAYSDQIAAGADAQSWDPSVKAMTAFPQVLAEMDRNLQWTTELGNAYYNQPQAIFAAVQVMRQRAQAAGNLQNSSQEAVSYDQGNILLGPVNPQTVYVPAYNPWTVYGEPVSPYPGFSLLDAVGSFFGSSAVQFGLGIAMTAFSHMSWGWLGWGLSWLAHSVLFHQSDYFSQSTTVADWGLPYGGRRAFSQGGGRAIQAIGSYRTSGDFGRRDGGEPAQRFMQTPYRYPYGGNRPADGYNRGYQTSSGAGYGRPPQQAFNHVQPMPNRPQQSGGSGYGSSFYSRPSENYGSRPGVTYGNSLQAYRAPAYGKPAHSGGFHLFGGGHGPKSFGGGKPKGFSGGKSYGGHSGGGGGHGSGRHHH